MKSRTALLFVLAGLPVGITGCANEYLTVVPLEDQRYRLEYDEPIAQPHSAASIFDWNLVEICPHGYEKTAERAERRNGVTVFVWEVRCLPASGKM